jgi:hypothetical protein
MIFMFLPNKLEMVILIYEVLEVFTKVQRQH